MAIEADPLLDQVLVYIIGENAVSISRIQRQFRLGFSRATRLVEALQAAGIVSGPGHHGNLTLLINDQKIASDNLSHFFEKQDILSALEYKNIDPDGFNLLQNYEQAMIFKQQGNYGEEERFLIPSVNPPSIYTGHYRELFIIWRMVIKMYIKQGKDSEVVSLIKRMINLDEEMILKLCKYWSERHETERSREYFIGTSNLKITDIKYLKNSSLACADNDGVLLADKYLAEFKDIRSKL